MVHASQGSKCEAVLVFISKTENKEFQAKHSNSCMISIYAFLFVYLAYILFQLMHRSVVQSTQIQLVVKDRLHPSTLVS